MTSRSIDFAGHEEKFRGLIVETTAGLAAYTGAEAPNRVVGRVRRLAMEANRRQLEANYRGAVEAELRNRLVLLTPQTASYLYSESPEHRTVVYSAGGRPELERVVERVTAGARSDRDRALEIMRFCRDLYKRNPRETHGAGYLYGGTEEELIEKGEELCECLGRLFVALCRIVGIRGRIVHHTIGGHIAAEARIEGGWAYFDPRIGLRVEKADGGLASTWDLIRAPDLLLRQPGYVRRDVSEQWSWECRRDRCLNRYFHPNEVTGFVDYSLADTDAYHYHQTTAEEAARAGMWEIHEEYVALSAVAFEEHETTGSRPWALGEPRAVPLVYRNDGFTPFFVHEPRMTARSMEKRFIDPLAGTNVEVIEWSVGPGSVVCYASRTAQVFGDGLSEAELALLREGDRRVVRNLRSLIDAGHDPLAIVTRRAKELGLRSWIRLEMNHEYGPADEENWKWVGFVGRFNKRHPEYRIPGTVVLDFRFPEVRAHKLAILAEAAQRGPDALSLGFCVYPPFFAEPDSRIMTSFMREVRKLALRTGAQRGRKLDIVVRVPTESSAEHGLDWRSWIDENLIDGIVAALARQSGRFDTRIDEVVEAVRGTECKVYGCLWQALGFTDTDPRPEDERSNRKRYDKPKTGAMFRAQAMLLHRARVDGLQLAMSSDEWNRRPWLDELADPGRIEYSDKTYAVDQNPHLPLAFGKPRIACVSLRVGDDVRRAVRIGKRVVAEIVLFCRDFVENERLTVFVNGDGPVVFDASTSGVSGPDAGSGPFAPEWWRRGERRGRFDARLLVPGTNVLRFVYSGAGRATAPLTIRWVDVDIRYR